MTDPTKIRKKKKSVGDKIFVLNELRSILKRVFTNGSTVCALSGKLFIVARLAHHIFFFIRHKTRIRNSPIVHVRKYLY